MPQGKYKSGRFRKIHVKVPGGATKLHYVERKPSKAICAETGKPLNGVPRERPKKLKCVSKSKRRPQRPFGGILCSASMRRMMIARARSENNV